MVSKSFNLNENSINQDNETVHENSNYKKAFGHLTGMT
jgi:hypothetical protein